LEKVIVHKVFSGRLYRVLPLMNPGFFYFRNNSKPKVAAKVNSAVPYSR